MIDPSNITNYNLTNSELEETILFWVCAAGKNGTTSARCLDNLLGDLKVFFPPKFPPLKLIRTAAVHLDLADWLKTSGIGCYTYKARTMSELAHANLDLRTCTTEDLEKIYGIGMKTSRCFIIHSRIDAPYAGLDTHMLKNLKVHGVQDVPKVTPSSKRQYKRLELEALRLSKEAGMTPANYDLSVWNKYAVK